jgi:sulfoxide reductase heme-binding subunit YedZ
MTSLLPSKERLLTHAILAILAVAACFLVKLLKPDFTQSHVLTVGLGYFALLLTAVTLLIGPLKLFRQRRNPVNIDLRRDIGIWAGITGCLHVVFGFQQHMGGNIVNYFFSRNRFGLTPMFDLFGVSNYLGAVATLILVLLLVLSNDISLRKLQGKFWKFLQRFNYLLIILVVLHTFGYQIVVKRESILVVFTIGITITVLIAQAVGFYVYKTRSVKNRQSRD